MSANSATRPFLIFGFAEFAEVAAAMASPRQAQSGTSALPSIADRACSATPTTAARPAANAVPSASGYRLVPNGKLDRKKRVLLDVKLADGRDAGEVLLAERLAQPWPNTGNIWCGTK